MPDLNSPTMLAASYALAALLGLIVGGFLTRAAFRMAREQKVLRPKSRCPNCGESLKIGDRIPVLSWLILKGKCRYCGVKLSRMYPAIEIVTALLFVAVFWRFGWVWATPVYMAFAAAMVLVTFVDFIDWTIPDEVTLPGIPAGILCALIAMAFPQSGLQIEYLYESVFDAIGGVIAGAAVLLALDQLSLLLLKKKGMGFGDVKLNAMIGAFIGYKGIVLSLVCASFIGSIIGIAVVLIRKQTTVIDDKNEGNYLPFGPYLAMGGLVVIFFGADLVDYYLNNLLPQSGIF